MPIAKGMPDTTGEREIVMSLDPVVLAQAASDGKLGMAAGSEGSINVWKDDAGKFRCERHRYKRMVAEGMFNTAMGARVWAKQAIKGILG